MDREACCSCGGSGSGVLVMAYAAPTGSVTILMVSGCGSDGCSCGSDHVGGTGW